MTDEPIAEETKKKSKPVPEAAEPREEAELPVREPAGDTPGAGF